MRAGVRGMLCPPPHMRLRDAGTRLRALGSAEDTAPVPRDSRPWNWEPVRWPRATVVSLRGQFRQGQVWTGVGHLEHMEGTGGQDRQVCVLQGVPRCVLTQVWCSCHHPAR